MGATTNNPFIIAIINMTIVFGVLIVLGLMMMALHAIDPTKKKLEAKAAPKAAAPVVAAAAAAVAAPAAKSDSNEIVAVIAAAVAAAQGTSANNVAIMSIAPSKAWKLNSAVEAISVRKDMF